MDNKNINEQIEALEQTLRNENPDLMASPNEGMQPFTLDEILRLKNDMDACGGNAQILASRLEQVDDVVPLKPSEEALERAERLLYLQNQPEPPFERMFEGDSPQSPTPFQPPQDGGKEPTKVGKIWYLVACCAAVALFAMAIGKLQTEPSAPQKQSPNPIGVSTQSISKQIETVSNYNSFKLVSYDDVNTTPSLVKDTLIVDVMDVPKNQTKPFHLPSSKGAYRIDLSRKELCTKSESCFSANTQRLDTAQDSKDLVLSVRTKKDIESLKYRVYILSKNETTNITIPFEESRFLLRVEDQQ